VRAGVAHVIVVIAGIAVIAVIGHRSFAIMSAASGFVILLALTGANLPFASERLFCVIALRSLRSLRSLRTSRSSSASSSLHPPVKGVVWRMGEFIVLYGVVIATGFALEMHRGNRFPQGWAFYVITLCMFAVFAFPGFVWRYLVRRGQG
jgi:hypothetical protein